MNITKIVVSYVNYEFCYMVTDKYSLYNGNGQLMTNEGNFELK